MRLGRYADAAEANRRAIAVDVQYIERVKPEGIYPMMYYPHNIHFLWAAASMEGRSQEALHRGNMGFRLAHGIHQQAILVSERHPLRQVESAGGRHIGHDQLATIGSIAFCRS